MEDLLFFKKLISLKMSNICYYGIMISHLSPSNHLFITQTVFIKCNCSLSKLHPRLPRRLHAFTLQWPHVKAQNAYAEGRSRLKFIHSHNVTLEGQNQIINCLFTLIMAL